MPQASLLPDGRLHLNHGPIDLIIQVWGPDQRAAYGQATARFQTVLSELADELPLLRAPLSSARPKGKIACDMVGAVARHTDTFVTPMAAVAGAVSDEICRAMCDGLRLDKAYVNNGGDISIHLGGGQHLNCAIHAGADAGQVMLTADQPARGLATSGWQGRSHSLGIADAVTVIARSAVQADVAATLIANAVNLPDHPMITRQPANMLSPDSDLGQLGVTTAVGPLTNTEILTALASGQSLAHDMIRTGKIIAAALFLRGHNCYAGETLAPTGEHHARLQTA